MCVYGVRVSATYFFILVLTSLCSPDSIVAETSCDTDSSLITNETPVAMVTVRYINESAVNITWMPVNDVDYRIEGFTVYYSSVSVNEVLRSCNGSAFFNNSTTSGIISDLSEDYDGYEFTVIIQTDSMAFGEPEITDIPSVIALRDSYCGRTSTTYSTAYMTELSSGGPAVPVVTIVSVIVCVTGTVIVYTSVLVVIICCYRKSQTQIKRLKKEVMAVNELDFPNPGSIGDASEYKVTPLYPLDTLMNSSGRQSSQGAADVERESVFGKKEGSSVE